MYGIWIFETRYSHGKNKKGISYYKVLNSEKKDILIASKTKYNENQYIKLNKDGTSLDQLIGPVSNYNSCKQFILLSQEIKKIKLEYTLDTPIFKNEYTSEFGIYTIDNLETKDYDDAFSYNKTTNELFIFITDMSNLEVSDLDYLIKNTSSFYDDEFTFNLFGDELCEFYSLTKYKKRNVICLKINLTTKEFQFTQEIITVTENLTYDEADKFLNDSSEWINFLENFKSFFGDVNDSHELVEKMMIFYNSKFHTILSDVEYPIRIHNGLKCEDEDVKFIEEINPSVLKKIGFHSAEYVSSKNEYKYHYALDIENYIHSTSPLRRITDFLAQKIAFKNYILDISKVCEVINDRQKVLKRAYSDIKLLNLAFEMDTTEVREFKALVTRLDVNFISIYIVDLDIFQKINLFRHKFGDLVNITIENNEMFITHTRNTDNVIKLKLYQEIDVIATIRTTKELNNKIKFGIINPNINEIYG